jgi:hypothetical protein
VKGGGGIQDSSHNVKRPASDAYLRDFQLFIPADFVCSNTPQENALALALIQQVPKADIRPSAELDLEALGQQ